MDKTYSLLQKASYHNTLSLLLPLITFTEQHQDVPSLLAVDRRLPGGRAKEEEKEEERRWLCGMGPRQSRPRSPHRCYCESISFSNCLRCRPQKFTFHLSGSRDSPFVLSLCINNNPNQFFLGLLPSWILRNTLLSFRTVFLDVIASMPEENFQPQVGDTSAGPHLHTYVPRADGAVMINGIAYWPAGLTSGQPPAMVQVPTVFQPPPVFLTSMYQSFPHISPYYAHHRQYYPASISFLNL